MMVPNTTDWIPVRLPKGPTCPHLVIVRTGATSLHRKWKNSNNQISRKFDLLISHFDTLSEPDLTDADIVVKQGSFKFGACHRLFSDIPWLNDYEAVWFCDDDILTDWETVNRLFDIFSHYNLDLAQPALSENSHLSHPITKWEKRCFLRYTNFVEIMVPLLSKNALALCLPTMENAVTGWGLDFVWPYLMDYPKNKIAIIDATPVTHTRPGASGPIYDQARELKVNPRDEMEKNLRTYNLQIPPLVEYGAIWKDPSPFDHSDTELTNRLRSLLLGLLALPPHTWGSLKPFSSDRTYELKHPQKLTIPKLTASDLAMSIGFDLILRTKPEINGCPILTLYSDQAEPRLTLAVYVTSDTRYRLTLTLFNKEGQSILLVLPELALLDKIPFSLHVIPNCGWVRCQLHNQKSGDQLTPPFAWTDGTNFVIGDGKLDGELDNLWVKPSLLSHEF